ncbi:protein EARLY FLOWERING 4-like [Lycium ferocissimum]|uniref:protein EARLY FLOWERING 4-like n=1 Tax=Lycium ferocissimum TaxID=112874 RepID=UPI0028162A61|nr:protein EARLY FLOWERING 4-like [Lycium ferocissimum]
MDGTLQFLSNLSDHRVEFNDNEEQEEEVYDTEAWEAITKCFKEVQSVLDQNRVLIQQVNENHESKVPDNMVKNVALIRDINSNISKVSRLYSNLSRDFCNIVHQRRTQALCEPKNPDDDVDTAES